MRSRWLLVLALGLVLVPAATVEAHAPAVLDPTEPYVVEDPAVSRALYGTFVTGDEVFDIRLRPATRIALPFEMLVPRRDGLGAHRPAYAVVAPGLPPPSPEQAARLPRPLPAGAGVFLDANDAPDRAVVFESFLRRVYWTSGPVALLVPAGDVELWIWSPDATTGDFVLAFGVEEGGIDYGDVLGNWGEYAY